MKKMNMFLAYVSLFTVLSTWPLLGHAAESERCTQMPGTNSEAACEAVQAAFQKIPCSTMPGNRSEAYCMATSAVIENISCDRMPGYRSESMCNGFKLALTKSSSCPHAFGLFRTKAFCNGLKTALSGENCSTAPGFGSTAICDGVKASGYLEQLRSLKY